jgi:hypothetical protein
VLRRFGDARKKAREKRDKEREKTMTDKLKERENNDR